jgi:hypothetical protein
MANIHEVIGFLVVAVFALGWLWPAGAAIIRKDPGERYWILITVEQVVAGVQAVIGLILFLALGRALPTTLHIVYGLGPLLILALAHYLARELQKTTTGRPAFPAWGVFGFASFICFGLTLRALMTGLGIG